MNLVQDPESVFFPATNVAFLEGKGPFQDTAPRLWPETMRRAPEISAAGNQVVGFMSLYKMQPEMIYRTCVTLTAPAVNLPAGFRYEKFGGGKYCCFVLTGAYSQLPAACGRAFEIVGEQKLPRRDDYNIELYVGDPKVTPEAELITHIMIPIL